MGAPVSASRAPSAGWSRLRTRLMHVAFLLGRPMTLGARAMVFREQDRAVLLVRHSYVPGWQFPGGGVEPGEALEEALARELREEANIELAAPPALKAVYFNRNASRRDHVAFYLVTSFSQTGEKVPDREIVEARFFGLDVLPADTTPATRRRVDEIFGDAPVSRYW
ncbi:NUDIX domain-containing protein [Nitratireductor sp. CAU 1489]|uniref:NUDIX domain-containing protein n=1 Tax=Nitratireductor arenosus TaxID=2682096 RepID=A0A844QHW9_9HYPH|nr:NUDIX domain-containing protein [Nitratireductor arenosus]MVA99516.1 NUDIX domain-containing protein [Nitratireductor arenosus]